MWIVDHGDVLGAVAVVVLLGAVIGGALLVNRPAQAQAGEVVTQPANSVGANPFSPSVSSPQASPSAAASPPPSQANLTSVNGAEPGLYGGTRNNSSCDREKLIDYLKNNPDKAAAWAYVEGISVADIPDYIRSLTPVVLRYDTRVTNHGFANGVATPYQSVLQAGTAVLVDRFGVPRARCYCGNPLLPLIPQSTPHYTGDTWPGWSPTTIIVVVPPGTPVTILTLAGPDGVAIGIRVGTDQPGNAPPSSSPPPSPAASPGASPGPPVNPASGVYKIQQNGTNTGLGNWPGGTNTCDRQTDSAGVISRAQLTIATGTITVTYLDAMGSGPISADGSFSVPLSVNPTTNTAMKGKVDSNGTVSGSFDTTYKDGGWGCSYPFTGSKVA